MKVRWLGWAGVEIEADGASVVIDPLEDPGATFAALGDGARDVQLPPVVAAEARRTAVGGMVSHLHRDHADSGALAAAMAPGATVHEADCGHAGCVMESEKFVPTLLEAVQVTASRVQDRRRLDA